MIGKTVSHYKIISKIGAGGMGVVYKALDTKLDRHVAIKFLPSELSSDANAKKRFIREAKAASSLNHANIAVVHEIDETPEGKMFMVMACYQGHTLKDKLERGALEVNEAIAITLQIASGLGTAHEKGILHRDIKPANVLLGEDGQAKLADFGLAKFERQTKVTKTGTAVGTISYMSPEQATGKGVDARSDVFSLGVVLFELLTGKLPFPGEHEAAVLYGIVNAEHARLADHDPNLPVALQKIVDKCLSKERENRYQSVFELANELRRAVTGRSISVPSSKPESHGSLKAEETAAPTDASRIAGLPLEQDIRYCTTRDGVNLAYSVVGTGPLLVRVLGYFTHLEMEWEWPALRNFWESLAGRHTLIRYDGRGIGLSDPYAGEFTEETRQLDLEAVLAAVRSENAALLGVSEGGWTAATHAVRHRDRITQLVLYGAYCRGARARPGYDAEEDQALMTLIRKGWGRDTAAFRQVITSQYFRDDADPSLVAYFNELQRKSADPDTAARYLESVHTRGDGRDLYQQIQIPTLVIHSQNDLAVSAEEGRLLASVIPGARLVLLPSEMHYFPTDRQVVTKAVRAITRFLKG